MSVRGPCADCDPSSASTASVSSDLHKYHVACSCGNENVPGIPGSAGQYAECAPTGPAGEPPSQKTERPPALPPRPPPRPRPNGNVSRSGDNTTSTPNSPPGPRKYVWWCMGMGTTACLLGGLLLAAAFILRALTTSLHHLETIPTPIPAMMLVLTGLCVMSLARRRNRYSYLIKVVGACCLVCALTCVLVTITTTVIHMNRLQTLRQCFYTDETKTCICSSVLMDSQNTSEDEGVRCVFEEVSNCNAVHGSLYRCLSAIFGLSVAGVLVCICSAMLAYQLLSHERKKMYWEQLELRCRSLYRPAASGQPPRPHNQQPQVCGECCTQCHAAAVANWDLQQRFWASGRVGNLYSPNPGTGRRVSPWSWFPWPRNSNQSRVGGSSSGDSAYGFGNNPGGYWQLGPPPPYTPHHRYLHHHNALANSSNHHHHLHHSHSPIHMAPGCPMMNQNGRSAYPSSLTPHGSISDLESQHISSSSHHHHHQGSLRMGMAICHQNNQTHSSIRVLQCHDSNTILSLSPGHFVPINDDDRQSDESIVHRAECHHQNSNTEHFPEKLEDVHHNQHACQKHGQHSEGEPTNVQGEENLGFQCEKQSSSRQPRGGESELYFADVSSCCNISLKTVEYCAGLVGTIEAQADISSGDSDVGPCPVFKGRPPRPRQNHNFQSANSPPSQLKNNLWKSQNSPAINCSSPNRTKKKNVSTLMDVEQSNHIQTRSSPSSNILALKCKSNTHFQDQPICFNCSDNSCKNSSTYLNEERGINQEEIIIGPSLSNISLSINNVENLPDESNNHNMDGAIRLSVRNKSSPHRNSTQYPLGIQTNDLNDVGLPPINEKKKAIDDTLLLINNKRMLDESVNNDQNVSISPNNSKDSENSITDSNSSIPSARCRNLNDSNLMNNSISSFRRGLNVPSPKSEDLNNSFSQINKKNGEEHCSSPLQQNISEESLLKRDGNFKSSIRRKGLDDSITSSDSNSSSSPLRRMFIEESSTNEEPSLDNFKMQLEESLSNSFNSTANVIRRKHTENQLLNSTIEPSARRTICENIDLNIPIRRMSIEDSLNSSSSCSSIIRKKGMDDSTVINREVNPTNPMRKKILDENNLRRKCADEALILLGNPNSSNFPLKRTILNENIFNPSDVNVAKLNLVHMMQHNARYSDDFAILNDGLNEPSLATESEGSRRGIVGGVCIAPDLRYEPVQGLQNEIQICNNMGTNHAAPVHMRCYSDSNTMDSGWQSGSEKHTTD